MRKSCLDSWLEENLCEGDIVLLEYDGDCTKDQLERLILSLFNANGRCRVKNRLPLHNSSSKGITEFRNFVNNYHEHLVLIFVSFMEPTPYSEEVRVLKINPSEL